MSSFLFVTGWSDIDVKTKINWANEIGRRGHDTYLLLPDGEKITEGAENVSGIYQLSLPDKSDIDIGPESIKSTYDIPNLRFLYQSEKNYFNLTEQTVFDRTLKTASALKTFFSNRSFEYVFQTRGSEIHRLLTYYIQRHGGGVSIWGDFSPFEDCRSFGTDLTGRWENYRTISYHDMTEHERNEIQSYIQRYKQEQKFYAHSRGERDNGSLISTMQSAGEMLLSDNFPRDGTRSLINKIKTKSNEKLNPLFLPSVNESKAKARNVPYVYFPLQYPAESRLTLFSPQFYKQSYIIEYLSRILPHGVKLFIKQHPNRPGEQSPLDLQKLSRKDNVELLNPNTNSHFLIDHAEALVVINNTVGFEGLFYSTPVVVLGTAFYMNTPGTKVVADLASLPNEIATAIDSSVDENTIISSIYSLKEASFELDGAIYSQRRASSFADSLLSFTRSR